MMLHAVDTTLLKKSEQKSSDLKERGHSGREAERDGCGGTEGDAARVFMSSVWTVAVDPRLVRNGVAEFSCYATRTSTH